MYLLKFIACDDGAFHCSIEKKCIPSEWHCDGIDDCDGEDELDCTGNNKGPQAYTGILG